MAASKLDVSISALQEKTFGDRAQWLELMHVYYRLTKEECAKYGATEEDMQSHRERIDARLRQAIRRAPSGRGVRLEFGPRAIVVQDVGKGKMAYVVDGRHRFVPAPRHEAFGIFVVNEAELKQLQTSHSSLFRPSSAQQEPKSHSQACRPPFV